MAWSNSVNLVEVTFGGALGTFGEYTTGEMTAVPVFTGTRYLVWASSGVPFLPTTEITATSLGTGASIFIPAADQPGWVDEYGNPYTNWHYAITVVYSAVDDNRQEYFEVEHDFQPISGQTPIDFDTLESTGTSTPVVGIKYPVQSVNGVPADPYGNIEVTFNAVSPGLEFSQDVPASQWSIPHNLGRRPAISLFDSFGNEFDTDIVATANLVTVTFPTPTSGSAVLT